MNPVVDEVAVALWSMAFVSWLCCVLTGDTHQGHALHLQPVWSILPHTLPLSDPPQAPLGHQGAPVPVL